MSRKITKSIPVLLFSSLILFACNNQGGDKKTDQPDSTSTPNTDTLVVTKPLDTVKTVSGDTSQTSAANSSLMKLAEEILLAIKKRDYKAIAQHIHPEQGVRFSLYAYVDTANDRILLPAELLDLSVSQKKVLWGEEDAREVQIILSLDQYLKRWVYDHDYLKAEKKAINLFFGGGNSLNNLRAIYPVEDFAQFYFSGFEERYDGMDFRGLRLVFKKLNGRDYLIGVIHDEWTI